MMPEHDPALVARVAQAIIGRTADSGARAVLDLLDLNELQRDAFMEGIEWYCEHEVIPFWEDDVKDEARRYPNV
jgi:hypothetical protein